MDIENLTSDTVAGGLRIYKIKNNDRINEIVREFGYKKGNSTLSSGVLDGKPSYFDVFDGPVVLRVLF